MSSQEKLTTGTFGSFHTGVDEQTGEFASVRIIDAPELESKIAVVVIKRMGYDPETSASPIGDGMWDYIKGEGMKAARLDGVDIARAPFHQYIAREYWEIIK
jgi:hypothetical protein|tara:strand:- start:942 stop:1247 length:306 start_codon:yes stop_codon:yes gene_type:complete